MWDHEATSVVRLLTREAMVEKIAYVLAKPVAAGLVRHAREWPGAQVNVSAIGRGALGAKWSPRYLDPEDPQWPEQAALPIHLPPGIGPDEAEGFRRAVAAELKRQEALAYWEVQRRGLRFSRSPSVKRSPTTGTAGDRGRQRRATRE